MIIRPSVRLSLLALISLIVLTACGGKKSNEASDKTVFRYSEVAGISNLDPARTASFEDILAIGHIFEGLVALDENMNVIPSIAASYDISEDGLEYTFNLRNDVFFHDDPCFPASEGRRVVASDFEYSFWRIADPDEPSRGKYIFKNLNKTEESNYLGFKAVDDRTFKIYLKQPQPSFLQMLSLKHCSVLPHEGIEKYGENFRGNPVGTGPFKFSFWNEGSKLVLLKNEDYWRQSELGESLPYLDAITITFLKDRLQEYLQFEKGKYEMISGLDPAFQEKLLTDLGDLKEEYESEMTFSKIPWLKTDYLGFMIDGTKPINEGSPIGDKRIRQAINYAIDREEMVTYVRKSIGKGAQKGFLPKGMPGFDKIEVEGYSYDPDKARELVKSAGYKGQVITLIVAEQYKQLGNYLQRKLKEVGLEVKVDAVTKPVHKHSLSSFQSNFFLKNWTADFPDATNFYQLFYSKNFAPENGPNYCHFKSLEFDELFERLIVENNDSTKFEIYNRMERILHDEAPVVPLFYDETVRFYSPNVSGIKSNSMNQLDLSEVKLGPRTQ